MSISGSVSHGDGDTIPEDLEVDYFPPNFKEYMLKEQLKWSRHTRVYFQSSYFGWVFCSEQDRQIEPSLSLDNWADFNPKIPNVCEICKVEYNIGVRHALQKLISLSSFGHVGLSLVQFWAPTRTSEGRTRLTTQGQPFALGPTGSTVERQLLCEYRMKMCSSEYNNCFYADADIGEEQLGFPGRVFRNEFPEFTPDVKYYSTKEYPQRDLARRCTIKGSWAVPVFEHSGKTCVGVLEQVSLYYSTKEYPQRNLLRRILEELGLQCLKGYLACEEESREKGKRVKGLAQALEELKMVLSSVCKTHELPLAMTWVPCSACNGLRRCKVSSTDVEFCLRRDHHLDEFLKASKRSHLRKGLVAGRACSSPNMLYCSDIRQLSLYDYPLVPYARLCKLSGWFTIYLQNVHTGNDIYVLEFFLSAINKNDENTTLSYILGTMEEKFETFRFASGKVLGELTSVEVIYFLNGQKIHSDERIQATRDFTLSSIPSSVQSSASVANKRPRFQDAIPEDLEEDYFPPNFKVYMREEQLKWWRHTRVYFQSSYFGWVFWSEQDRQIELSLSLDYWADFNPNVCAIPKVEYNIRVRHALQKLISLSSFGHVGLSLVQFWAPTRTSEGRTRLTTQGQPFALGPTRSTVERQLLCEYRMKMCSSEYNNCFYADADIGEEQLGNLGRVFLHKYPEFTPDVNYYSKKEYPQRDLARRCTIKGSWAVPVFEHSSKTCVGVLEQVSLYHSTKEYPQRDLVLRILEEFGLQC